MIIVPRKVLGYLREKDRRYVYLIVVRLLILRIFVPRYVYLIESFIREGRVSTDDTKSLQQQLKETRDFAIVQKLRQHFRFSTNS